MQCKYCEPTAHQTAVCRIHGTHKIRIGIDAPNYRNGEFTNNSKSHKLWDFPIIYKSAVLSLRSSRKVLYSLR